MEGRAPSLGELDAPARVAIDAMDQALRGVRHREDNPAAGLIGEREDARLLQARELGGGPPVRVGDPRGRLAMPELLPVEIAAVDLRLYELRVCGHH